MISRYPDGVTGAALLLLRLAAALFAYPALAALWPSAAAAWPATILAAGMGLALAAGFGTRFAALLLVAVLAGDGLVAGGGAPHQLLASAASAAALALLGPGAYSLDAKRSGRRVIRLDSRSPDRGRPD